MRCTAFIFALSGILASCTTANSQAGAKSEEKHVMGAPRELREPRGTVSIAVLPLENNTGDNTLDSAGRGLAEFMAQELLSRPQFAVVERQRLSNVLQELRLSQTAVMDQEIALQVGRLIGARLMVFGGLAAFDGQQLISLRIVDVETSQVLSGAQQRRGQNDQLDELARRAMRKALSGLDTPQIQEKQDGREEALLLNRGPKRKSRSIGIVIGVQKYKNRDVPTALFAVNDAREIRRMLVENLGYDEADILFLENPTKADFEAIFGAPGSDGRIKAYLRGQAPSAVDLFVYYSGHGAPGLSNRQAYLALSDASPDYIETTGYPRSLLIKNLSRFGARNTTLVLESCFSGTSGGGALFHNASPLVIQAHDDAITSGITLISSSGPEEISSWYPEKRQSLFTHHLLKKLKDNPKIRLGELVQSITPSIEAGAERLYGRKQKPRLSGDARSRLFE